MNVCDLFIMDDISCLITIYVIITGPLKEAANILMLIISGLDIFTHYSLDEALDRSSLSIVFMLLLTCRLIVYLQIKAKDNEESSQDISKSEAAEPVSEELKKEK